MSLNDPPTSRPDVTDALDRLAEFRPTVASVSAQWSPIERAELRAILIGRSHDTDRLHFVPRRRQLRVGAPILAGVALVCLLVGVVVYVARTGSNASNEVGAAGPPYTASGVVSTPTVGPGEYAYREVTEYTIKNGARENVKRNETWVSPSGETWFYRTPVGGRLECGHRPPPPRSAGDFSTLSQRDITTLPTDRNALESYLRSHVMGSTSRDEAVFVAVGDLLRNSDLLASSELRAAFVEVLSRTARVTVHPGVRDDLGRAAVRADFIDQHNRPGDLESLYFDASTFQLLEERSGHTDGPIPPYASTSYDATAIPTSSPQDISGDAQLYVLKSERVVQSLPANIARC